MCLSTGTIQTPSFGCSGRKARDQFWQAALADQTRSARWVRPPRSHTRRPREERTGSTPTRKALCKPPARFRPSRFSLKARVAKAARQKFSRQAKAERKTFSPA